LDRHPLFQHGLSEDDSEDYTELVVSRYNKSCHKSIDGGATRVREIPAIVFA
jgi:hypothetical protein